MDAFLEEIPLQKGSDRIDRERPNEGFHEQNFQSERIVEDPLPLLIQTGEMPGKLGDRGHQLGVVSLVSREMDPEHFSITSDRLAVLLEEGLNELSCARVVSERVFQSGVIARDIEVAIKLSVAGLKLGDKADALEEAIERALLSELENRAASQLDAEAGAVDPSFIFQAPSEEGHPVDERAFVTTRSKAKRTRGKTNEKRDQCRDQFEENPHSLSRGKNVSEVKSLALYRLSCVRRSESRSHKERIRVRDTEDRFGS